MQFLAQSYMIQLNSNVIQARGLKGQLMHLVLYMRVSQLKVEYTHPMHNALDVDVGEDYFMRLSQFRFSHIFRFFFSFVIIYHFRL